MEEGWVMEYMAGRAESSGKLPSLSRRNRESQQWAEAEAHPRHVSVQTAPAGVGSTRTRSHRPTPQPPLRPARGASLGSRGR